MLHELSSIRKSYMDILTCVCSSSAVTPSASVALELLTTAMVPAVEPMSFSCALRILENPPQASLQISEVSSSLAVLVQKLYNNISQKLA